MFFGIGLAVFCVYAAYSFVSAQYDISKKNRELAEMTVKVEEQAYDNSRMKAMLENEATYVEEMARTRLGFGYLGEKYVVDINVK